MALVYSVAEYAIQFGQDMSIAITFTQNLIAPWELEQLEPFKYNGCRYLLI